MYAQHGHLDIRAVSVTTPRVKRYAVEELNVDLSATFDNPFDSSDVAVDASVRDPKGQVTSVPGFFTRPFRLETKGGKELPAPSGPPGWRVRIAPQEIGTYAVSLTARDRSGFVQSSAYRFECVKGDDPGFIRLSPVDRRYFAFDNGSPYFPIGANIAWGGDAGMAAYDRWLPKYGAQGANYGRLWMGPLWATFAMETAGTASEGKGFGQFDLGNADRLDRVLALAERQHMYMMLSFDSYNTLRDRDAYPQWERTPLNATNGGPLQKPTDFWSNPRMRKVYRDRLRYMVARYGANRHVFAWEFWNEVDLTRGFDPKVVADWHREMGDYLRGLDPQHHLVTTSFSNSIGTAAIDSLPQIDFIQTHLYTPNLVHEAAILHRLKGHTKAHFIGEIGADGGGPRAEDKEGVQVHDALWVGIANGMAGTGMNWWWDNLIEPNNLYPLFGAAAHFSRGIDWPHQSFHPVSVLSGYSNPEDARGPADLELTGGPTSFGSAAHNRPQTIRVGETEVTGDLPMAGLLHGRRNHPDLHNPATFLFDRHEPTHFEIVVGDVSGWGGARLEVSLDGKPISTLDFKDPDDQRNTDPLKQYAGAYPFEIPAGRHELKVENTGNDWLTIGYRIKNLLPSKRPPLETYAVTGRSQAIVWVRLSESNWTDMVVHHRYPKPCPPVRLTIPGLPPGKWRAEVWDTWEGVVLSRADVSTQGQITLPKIVRDVAVRLQKL